MRTTRKGQKRWIAGAALCFIALFTTCKNNIGLGGTIDINPPVIDISTIYPPSGAVIKGQFTLAVNVSDDTSVHAVTVTITNKDTGGVQPEGEAGFFNLRQDGENHWIRTDVNTKDKTKGFPLKDGNYKVQILAVDSEGKTTRAERDLVIDNTPPLLVLDRPSTAALDPSAAYAGGDTFGDGFWLIGQAYDKSNVAKLVITTQPVGGGTEYTRTIQNVPANIRLKVDSFSDDIGKSEFYCGLYGTTRSAGKKQFRYALRIFDNAKEYKNPGNGGSGEGNTSSIYYLKDDIDKKVLRNRRLQDVYAVLYGTPPASISDADAAVIKDELAKPQNRIGGEGERTGVFALNPSVNPTFEIPGATPSKEVSGNPNPDFQRLYAGSSLRVRLSRNLDDVALNEVNLSDPPSSDPYQFYLVKWDKYKEYGANFDINKDEDAAKPGVVRIERKPNTGVVREGGNYVFTIPVIKTAQLEYERYVLLVRGKDKDGYELIGAQNDDGAHLYGITLENTQQPPQIAVINIYGKAGTGPGDNVTERVYAKKGDAVPFKIRLDKPSTVTYKVTGTPGLPVQTVSSLAGEYEFPLPITAFDQTNGGNYQLSVKASADGNTSVEQTYHIAYDVKPPEVIIVSPVDNEKRNYDNREITISGTAFDAGVGLKGTDPVTATLSKTDGTSLFTNRNLPLNPNGENWNTAEIDLSVDGEGTYQLAVTAEDQLGQALASPIVKTFMYDAAPPTIINLQINGTSVTDGDTVFNTTGSVTVTGTAQDTYGIASVTINGDPVTSVAAFTKTLSSLSDGRRQITIKAIDKAGKEISQKVTVVVDTVKPSVTPANWPPAAAWQKTKTVQVSGTADDATSGLEKIEAIVNGTSTVLGTTSPWSGYLTLNEDNNTVKFKVTDNADNTEETAEVTIKVDTGIPKITLTSPANGQTFVKEQTYQVTVNVSDVGSSGIEKVEYAQNSGFTPTPPATEPPSQSTSGGFVSINLSGITADTTYYFRAVDNAGNISDSVRVNIVKDATGPTINVISPLELSIATQKPVFKASISDNAGIKANTAKVYYKKITVPPSTTEQSFTLARDSDGSYTVTPAADMDEGHYELYFSAEDELGNKTSTKPTPPAPPQKITIDKAPPTLADVKVNNKTDNTVYIKNGDGDVTVTGTATDSYGIARVGIWDGSTEKLHTESVASDGSWTLTFSGSTALADGTHNLTIRATDKADKKVEVQKTVVVDRIAPTITPTNLPSAGAWLTTQQLFITGTASDATSRVKIVEAVVTGGSPSNEILTLLSGAESWSGNLTLNKGENKIKFRVTDNAGNTYETPETTVKVDIDRPTIALTTPANGQVLINGNAYTVTVTVNDVGSLGISGIAKVEYTTDAGFASPQHEPTSDGSVSIPLSGITADTTYYFRAVDAAGNQSDSVRVIIQKDSTPPEVSFVSHQDNQEVNKKITIIGSASDNRELKSVKVVKADGTELTAASVSGSSGVDPSNPDTADNKAFFVGTKAYNWRFTLDTIEYPDNAELKLKAIATDTAGNQTEKELTLKVNQDSDRPVVTVTNFTHIADANLVGSRILTGKVEDDDGPISAADIKIRVSPATNASGTPIGPSGSFETVTASNGVWRYTIPADKTDGKYHLDFELKDAAGTEFKTQAATPQARPFVMGYEDGLSDRKDQNIEFRLDTIQPEFKTGGVSFVLGAFFSGSSIPVTPNAIIGNSVNQHASFRAFVKDASGIKKVELKLNNGTAIPGVHSSANDAGKYEAWDFTNVQLVEGAVKLSITATDNANFDKTWEEAIITDFTAPTIGVEASTLNTVYYRNADIIGSVTETGGGRSGIDETTIQYKIGNSGWLSEKDMRGTELSRLEKTSATWKVIIPDISSYTAAYGAVAPTAPGDKMYKLPVTIKVSDKAGNERISTEYLVKFDPAGSTPIVELISPDANATLGTTVLVSGLARKTKPDATGTVQRIELQLSQTNGFGNPWTLNGQNYGGTATTGITLVTNPDAYWQKTLDAAVITDILGGADSKEVWFRVRGVSSTGAEGEWTAGRKFTISKDAAQFSDIKLAIGSTETPYVPNGTWIRGDDYIIKGSVTHSQGIKAPPALQAKTENVGSSIKPLDTSDTTGWFTPRPNGYDFAIKIKTSHYPEKSGSIEFDIIAEDARTTGAITVRTQIRLQYDNSIPQVAIGTPVVKGANTAFSASTFTPEIALTDPKERYVVIANNKRYTVSSISGASVTLSPADLTGNFDYAIAERPAILQGANCQIEGIGEDSGAGIQKVVVTLTVSGQSESVTLNANDSPRTIDPQRNNLASFRGTLDTTAVPNGQGTLKVTAYDGAGNEVSDEITTIRVKNSPLAISKVTLRTDLDGDGKYPDSHPAPTSPIADEKCSASLGGMGGLNAEKDFRGTADVKDVFTYKNNTMSDLAVELTGGYGSTRKIVLYKDDASNAANKITELDISSASTSLSSYVLNLAGKLNAIGDGAARKLILRVYDGSVGELWYAQAEITVKVAHSDTQNPSGVIAPFFYNTDKTKLESTDDFKLTSVKYNTGTKEPLGHIEIAAITGLNAHPSVSGTVILRGIAYDNARIKELNLSGAGINGTVGRTITNTSGSWSEDNGFKVVKNNYSRTGHYVEWEYEWATGTPALAQTVTLTVTDSSSRTNGNSVSEPTVQTGIRDTSDDRLLTLASSDKAVKYQFVRLFDGEKSYLVQVNSTEDDGAKIRWTNATVPTDITQYRLYEPTSNKASLTVNIVPYITDVVTALSTADSVGKGAFSRASTGEYPVRAGDTIEIKGFNLSSGTVMLGTANLGSMPSVSIAASHTSGDLSVKVGSVESVNNKVDVTKPYNKEGNGINNDTLTANRKLFVWVNKTVINNNFMESPQFVMDKGSNYYMSLGSLASGGAMRFYLVQNPNLSSSVSSMKQDALTFEQCYSKYHNTAVAFDESGEIYGAATNTDKASGSTSFTFFSREKGDKWAGTGANYDTGTNKRRLENSENANRNVYDVNRVQIPKLTVRGNASSTKVGLVYYDRNNNEMPVKFRYGTIDSGADDITGGLKYNVNRYGSGSNPAGSGSAEGYEIVANATSTHGSGQYAAVGLTSTNRAIVVWYDATNSNLVYSYRDMGTSYTEPTASNRYTNDWQNHAVVIDGGAPLYVDLVLDDQDGLHIGYYSSSKSGVRYAYLAPDKVKGATKPDASDFKIATVDTFMNPGSFLKIGVRAESGKQVPYLSYYHSGFSGSKNAARMAWLKGGVSAGSTVNDGVVNHKFTGDWVVMTVPATAGIQQYTICQGVPTGGTYANKVIAAYFTNKNYEMAILKK